MQRARRIGAALTGFALIATLSACGGDSDDDPGETVEIAITIENGEVDPSGDRVEVGVGQPIDLVVTADEPGSLHMHTDPEQELAYDAGTKTFQVEIDRPGVVVLESHELDTTIVQLQAQ